jgi:hypothetical protein
VIGRLLPHIGFGPDSTGAIADHVARFSLGGLAGIRRELESAKRGGRA